MNEIKFYHTNDRPEKIDKTLTGETVVEGGFLREMSTHFPVIRLNGRLVTTDWNVAYIPRFKRWYFIDERVEVAQDTIELRLRCDYLMTFKDTVLQSTVKLARSSAYNPNAKGLDIAENNGVAVVKTTLPNPFVEGGVNILVVANNKGGL